MQYLGAVKTLNEAKTEAEKITKKENRIVVIEKAKCKSPDGKYHVCYRAWMDRTMKKKEVITWDEWKRRKK